DATGASSGVRASPAARARREAPGLRPRAGFAQPPPELIHDWDRSCVNLSARLALSQHFRGVYGDQHRHLIQDVGQVCRVGAGIPTYEPVLFPLAVLLCDVRRRRLDQREVLVDRDMRTRRARQHVFPRQVVPDVDRGLLVDIQPEAWLTGALLDDEEPAWVVARLRAVVALRLLSGQVEAEEVDIWRDLRLVQWRLDDVTRGVGFLRRRQLDQPPLHRVVDVVVARLPARAVRVDHRVRILLQQLAANNEHYFLLGLATFLAVIVITQLREAGPQMQRRDIAQLFAQRIGVERRVGFDVARHIPELAEVAAALVGRILAPQQFARKLVVEAGHVRFDEFLVGFQQRDAVLLDQLNVRQKQL